ncbi:MAG: hypothetical protein Q9208_002136 [Pyrenodesmia sp. 3 TL-2023]
MTINMSSFAVIFLLALTNAYYLSPNPWTTNPTTIAASPTNTTQAAPLLPRQDPNLPSGGVLTIYANGAFLDEKYAEYFACGAPSSSPAPFTTAVLPPSSTEEAPIPAPTPPEPGEGSKCNTIFDVVDIELQKGSDPASFLQDDMKELFTDACDDASRYPISNKNLDKTYKNGRNDNKETRLVAAARSAEAGGKPPSVKFDKGRSIVNLRIEGASNTIYEGPILSGPRNITTPSGGTHKCDGTNLNANPYPGNTPTGALDAASKLRKFPYDGTYSDTFEDYFITSIGNSTQTVTQFWGLLVNYQFTPVGGCQQEIMAGDNVLWAFDAFGLAYFLKVTPSVLLVKKGSSKVVTVTDGVTGVQIEGAVINSVTTDAYGKATLAFPKTGLFQFKAKGNFSVRSNAVKVVVT